MGGNYKGRQRNTEKSSSQLQPEGLLLARAPRGVLIRPKALQDFPDSRDYGYGVCLCLWAHVQCLLTH